MASAYLLNASRAYPAVPYNVGQINGNAAGDTSFGTALLDALVQFTLATGLELLYDFNGKFIACMECELS